MLRINVSLDFDFLHVPFDVQLGSGSLGRGGKSGTGRWVGLVWHTGTGGFEQCTLRRALDPEDSWAWR